MPATIEEISHWYLSLKEELTACPFSNVQKDAFIEYYTEAGLFTSWRRAFFIQHFAPSFLRIFNFLSEGKSVPVILDLGCGMGTQSLFFAMHGAKVFSADMDELSLSIFAKRKQYYEDKLSRKLDITLIRKNAFDIVSQDLPVTGVDGLFSIFAFNMMKPPDVLLSRLSSFIRSSGRIAVLDGNNMAWLSKVIPSRRRDVLSPPAFSQQLKKNGFITVSHSGAIVVPPVLWNLNLMGAVSVVDKVFGRDNWFFPISHLIMAEKQ